MRRGTRHGAGSLDGMRLRSAVGIPLVTTAALLLTACSPPDGEQRGWIDALGALDGVASVDFEYIDHQFVSPPEANILLTLDSDITVPQARAVAEASCAHDTAFSTIDLAVDGAEIEQDDAAGHDASCLDAVVVEMFARTVATIADRGVAVSISGFTPETFTDAPTPARLDAPYLVHVTTPDRKAAVAALTALHGALSDYSLEVAAYLDDAAGSDFRAKLTPHADLARLLPLIEHPLVASAVTAEFSDDAIAVTVDEATLADPAFADLIASAAASGITLTATADSP